MAQTEQMVVAQFQEKRQQLSAMAGKINELRGEIQEHEMVLKTLETMDRGRKCFRLIDQVLVERTVGEVQPAVAKNLEGLTDAVNNITESAKKHETELNEFQAKYKIRIVGPGEEQQ
ncbi:hypothetical protein FOA52_000886 [Chlamydomonas sp. UWO 241]|nr:hypothetical protein FOA52_000886 [Chlamydomonas sp. UWO 241]